eukprot:5796872-Alexandrium_andersonii.AAC.1
MHRHLAREPEGGLVCVPVFSATKGRATLPPTQVEAAEINAVALVRLRTSTSVPPLMHKSTAATSPR